MKRCLPLLAMCVLAACDKPVEEKKVAPLPALITVTQVGVGEFEVVEETLGTLEALHDPKISAETPGRIIRLHGQAGHAVRRGQLLAEIDPADTRLQNAADEADVRRMEALAAQQDKLLERQRTLVAQGFLSKNAGDDLAAQRSAVHEQLAALRARAEGSRRSMSKTRVLAPFDGLIDTQIAAAGDYVKAGDPLFQLVAPASLRAHLPFPESAAARIKRGQPVRLVSPLAPGQIYLSSVREIRPGITEGSRTLDVQAEVDNPDGVLRAGGTVNATIRLAAQVSALTVPEQSVVLRPAGKVVYAIVEADGQKKAQQKIIQAGAKRDGRVEILAGLAAGETIALEGAGFLSHNAVVAIKEAGKPGDKAGPKTEANPPPKVGAGDTAAKPESAAKPVAQ